MYKCLQRLIIFPFVSESALNRIFFVCVFNCRFFHVIVLMVEMDFVTDSISFIIILSSFCNASFVFCFKFLFKYVFTVTVATMGFKIEYLTVQFASFFARCCLLILRRRFMLTFKCSCTWMFVMIARSFSCVNDFVVPLTLFRMWGEKGWRGGAKRSPYQVFFCNFSQRKN